MLDFLSCLDELPLVCSVQEMTRGLCYMLCSFSANSDAGSDTSSVTDTASFPIDYGSTPGGQGDGSLDREKAEGEVTLRDMSVSSFLDEVSVGTASLTSEEKEIYSHSSRVAVSADFGSQ